MVTTWLRQQGYSAHNLDGGVDAWARTVEPAMRRY
jgi:rhodanese-related sulfurtransferase